MKRRIQIGVGCGTGVNEFLIKRYSRKGSTAMREIDQEKIFHAFLKGVAVGLFAAYLFFDFGV